jgi:enoyl-CoA hydratase/carnithine racemase
MTSPPTAVPAPSGGSGRTWSHLHLDRRSASYWRVTFDHPPINTITATIVTELVELIDLIEDAGDLNVIVFDSASPDFFLAHYDTEHAAERSAALPSGPTGLNAWLDFLVRLSRAPVASIAMIRGRTRGGGSEFVLACDMRFASRENTFIGQFEVSQGLVPGGGAMARLARLVGRGRALEIILVGNDCNGPTAELYGYVNRAVPDAELDGVVDGIATRLAGFDHEAVARAKSHVDPITLPDNTEYAPALKDFFDLSAPHSSGGPTHEIGPARLEHRQRPRAEHGAASGRGRPRDGRVGLSPNVEICRLVSQRRVGGRDNFRRTP